MNRIRSWLYVGNFRDTLDHDLLVEKQIHGMLQLEELVEHPGIVSLFLPVEDFAPLEPRFLDQGIAFVRDSKRRESRVLIACAAGISRSCAFATAVLKEEEGLNLLEAFLEVKRRHRDAMPHLVVWESLCRYYQEDVPYMSLPG